MNLPLMEEARHAIRMFSGHPGYKLETYNKSQFVKKYGISMYVPRENANLPPQRLIRSLFYKNPTLRTKKITFLCKTIFESDPPGHPVGRRSRVGDAIFLFDSPELANNLYPFQESHQFYFNNGFSVTLKGGGQNWNAISLVLDSCNIVSYSELSR